MAFGPLSRRTFLRHAPAAAAAGALVAALPAAADASEHPWVTARRLAKELSTVLAAVAKDPIAGQAVVAIIKPEGTSFDVAFADLDYYTSAWSRMMTTEQAAATAAWQIAAIEQQAQWDVYASFKSHREGQPAYREWQRLYAIENEARLEMTRAFFPFDRVAKGS